jgi:plastocyanin
MNRKMDQEMNRRWKSVFTVIAISVFFMVVASFTVLPQTNGDDPAAVVVQMSSQVPMKFEPNKVTVKVGQTVEWVNMSENGGPLHNVTTDPTKVLDPRHVSSPEGALVFDSGPIKPGKSFSHKFTVPGVYNYACSPHEGSMLGQIVVER